MEPILTNQFITIGLDAERELLHIVWTPQSEDVEDEFFREVNLLYVEQTSKRKLSRMFLNTKEFLYTISVDMQDWVNTHILPQLIQNGIKRIAFLMSQEFIAQLSIVQTMEDIENKFVRYFDNEEEAIKWLCS
jgi:SpoIIAA-like